MYTIRVRLNVNIVAVIDGNRTSAINYVLYHEQATIVRSFLTPNASIFNRIHHIRHSLTCLNVTKRGINYSTVSKLLSSSRECCLLFIALLLFSKPSVDLPIHENPRNITRTKEPLSSRLKNSDKHRGFCSANVTVRLWRIAKRR